MLAWAIAIFAVAAVLGSVMWLKPSPAQQRQTRMRLLARQYGLDVRLVTLPQTRRNRVRQEATEQGVVYRLLRFDIVTPLPHDYLWVRENSEGVWEQVPELALTNAIQKVIDDVLVQMPRDVVAVELTPHGPGVYWRERGDEQTLKKLRELMEKLLQALSTR
ncbi:MAG: hypothetical protein JWM78_517 [Verrucomicrobiaceae bacterium]|nr:hypothetical protein [Verrucomicrobiaceae bacterium]